MKKLILFISMIILFGCSNQGALEAEDYVGYKCFDYHLACLDAYSQKAKTVLEFDGIDYTVQFRKAVGVSDSQFICAKVCARQPLATADHGIMQNPDDYIDVLKDWTVNNIELYYKSVYDTKEDDEPARVPTKILSANSDSIVAEELIGLLTSTVDPGKYEPGNELKLESDEYTLYIRIHFNESETIVWDSHVDIRISSETKTRVIAIDKGRTPKAVVGRHSIYVSIENCTRLKEWISAQIEKDIGTVLCLESKTAYYHP